jgi:hypothetical protein
MELPMELRRDPQNARPHAYTNLLKALV